mgnify:CR=1 FL=1
MKLKFIGKLNKKFGNDFNGVLINEEKKNKEFNCGNRRTIIREEGQQKHIYHFSSSCTQ